MLNEHEEITGNLYTYVTQFQHAGIQKYCSELKNYTSLWNYLQKCW